MLDKIIIAVLLACGFLDVPFARWVAVVALVYVAGRVIYELDIGGPT